MVEEARLYSYKTDTAGTTYRAWSRKTTEALYDC